MSTGLHFTSNGMGYPNIGLSDPSIDNKNVDSQQGATKPSTGQSSDTLTKSTFSGTVVADAYVAPAGQPGIPQPPGSQYGQSGSFQFLSQNQGAASDGGAAGKVVVPNPNDVYQQSVNDQLAQMKPDTAARVQYVLENPGLDYKSMGGDFAKAAKLADQIMAQATAEVKTTLGISVFTPPAPDPDATEKRLGESKAAVFEQLLGKTKNLTPEERDQLEFAFLHPELNTDENLSPKLQKLLKSLSEKTEKNFNNKNIAPKGTDVTPESSVFEAKIANGASDAVEKFVSDWAETCTPAPTQDEINYVRNAFYFPGSDNPLPKNGNLSPELLNAMADGAKNAAKAYLASEFNAPSSWSPDINNANYTSTLEGAFDAMFEQNMANHSPPLTDAQKTQLRQALGMSTENVPPEIKELFDQLKTMSMNQVVEMFGVPPGVSIKTKDLSGLSGGVNSAQFQQMQTELNNGKEAMNFALAYAQQMPEGPEKNSMMNIAMKIGMALAKAQAFLYTMLALDSEAQTKLVMAKKDTELNKIQREKEQAEKIRKQQEKQKTWGWVGIILVIFCFPLVMMLGPVLGTTLFTLSVVNCVQQAQGDTTLFDKLIKAVTSLLEMFLPKGLAKIVLAVLKIVYMPLLLMAGPMEALNQVMAIPTDIVAGLLMTCGMKEDLAQEVAMFTVIALEVIAMIVITIATLGAGSEVFALIPQQMAVQSAQFAAEGAAAATTAAEACSTAVTQAVAQGMTRASMVALEEVAQSTTTTASKAMQMAESILQKAETALSKAMGKVAKANQAFEQAQGALARAIQTGDEAAISSARQSVSAAETLVNVSEKTLESANKALNAASKVVQETQSFVDKAADFARLVKTANPSSASELTSAANALTKSAAGMEAASTVLIETATTLEFTTEVLMQTLKGVEQASSEAASEGLKASFSSGMRGLMKEGGEFKRGLDNFIQSWIYSITRSDEAIMQVAIKVVVGLSVTYTLITTAQQVAKSISLAIIARLQALMDAEIQVATAIIKLLQQVIQSLLDGIQNTTAAIKSLGKALSDYNQQMIRASSMAA